MLFLDISSGTPLSPGRDAPEQQPCSLCFPLRESTIFNPKTPILIVLTPNSSPKFVYTFMNLKRQSKPYKTWNQNIIPSQIINSPIFHKTFKNNSIHTTTPWLWTPIVWIINNNISWQQQQRLTMNPSTTTTTYFTNFEQNTNMYVYTS